MEKEEATTGLPGEKETITFDLTEEESKMIVNKTALPYGSSWHELISASPLPILWIWTSTSLLRPFFYDSLSGPAPASLVCCLPS
jgi:hypothetical protein